MKLITEKSIAGQRCATIRPLEVKTETLEKSFLRSELKLPEVSEVTLARHYTELSRRAFGVDTGFYPLGSCTMKYNPKINEEVAGLEGFTHVHPLCEEEDVQGCMQAMYELTERLKAITGMDALTLEPAAGAHGEYVGLMLIAAYHKKRKDSKRTKIIVPDSAHGTNPASAVMAGFEVVNVPSDENQGVDIEALKKVVGDDTAALMLTNPTTLGLFEKNIKEITEIVHNAGGLVYYDGANLNAIMGVVRPGDMGFDVVHLNLHKTFSTPHGGGGPGSGPVGCKAILKDFLPGVVVELDKKGEYVFAKPSHTIGKVMPFFGNFGVCLKALAYIKTLGAEGIKEASQNAVLNANYIKKGIEDLYPTQTGRFCMHEFVISCDKLKAETGVAAMDIAKSMIDNGMHPPTMYFPLIVHEALMIEPTETESKETLDEAIAVLRKLHKEAYENPEQLKSAPHHAQIFRPDEVMAARKPVLKG
ncbi:MAG: aminomethyl-transferring glycine dehydrogenase subunit GcvPB [Clostridia bacterium]|nr:aminomethyl-transferring glycine dehydrogenase subunit GcvPB [Clostridia bacterium]